MNPLIESISHYLQNSAFPALFLDAWLKSLAVLAVAGGLCFLLRRAAAATRHWIWFLALATLPCLLLLAWAPHTWQRPLWSVSTGLASGNQITLVLNLAPSAATRTPANDASPARTAAAAASGAASRNNQPIAATFSLTALAVAVAIWLSGAVLGLASILAGRAQLSRLARNGVTFLVGTRSTASLKSLQRSGTRWNASLPVEAAPMRGTPEPLPTVPLVQAADWALLLQEACDRLRLRRPVRLLQSSDNPMPLTWGWCRPVVLLPADAANWPTDRRRLVLLHELAHAKRWDCLTQTLARVVCALYWLNPLVWLAVRRMCVERERACDDLVLNSGCRASDYATHLADIARSFRPVPQFAGIAMARSAQLQGRVAAIVDASRARRLRPLTALVLFVLMGALALSVGGSSPSAARSHAEDSALRQRQIAQLEAFARVKEKQSEELAAKAGEKITPEFQRFFAAAIQGDWRTVTNRWEYYHLHHRQYEKGTNATIQSLDTPYWQPVLELCMAYTHVVNCAPKYTALFADGIINSIPPGSIYFGGTDPGRCVPTAFVKSHADADPFFILTQNALADGTYLEYLRAMYDGKIYTPTGDDLQRCFTEYTTEAERRLQEHKLKPGEDVKMVEGKVQISGQVAVMSLSGLLTKLIFDHNTNRQFYVEESFPLDWMYPYLEPHGLIMKLNRQPLAQLPEEVIARDHEYWCQVVGGILGDWLDDQTTVREIADFVDRVYVRKNLKGFPDNPQALGQMPMSKIVEWNNRIGARKNLKGFTGDPLFVQNGFATASFSKLRSSIGGLYAWRLNTDTNICPAAYQPKSQAEYQQLRKEADFAFRQALALCPYSPEVVFRYAQLLLQEMRFDDALLVAQTCLKLDPKNGAVEGMVGTIKSYKKQSASTHPPQVSRLVVRIDSQGNLRLGDDARPVSPEDFKAALLAAVAKTPDLGLVINTDKNAPPEQVIKVTDAAKEAKLKSVMVTSSTLTAAQALALAEQLANEKAQTLYNCQPFRNGPPAKLVQGYWVWHDQRGQGAGDVEATVKFAADGTNPDVNVILLDSRPRSSPGRLPP